MIKLGTSEEDSLLVQKEEEVDDWEGDERFGLLVTLHRYQKLGMDVFNILSRKRLNSMDAETLEDFKTVLAEVDDHMKEIDDAIDEEDALLRGEGACGH